MSSGGCRACLRSADEDFQAAPPGLNRSGCESRLSPSSSSSSRMASNTAVMGNLPNGTGICTTIPDILYLPELVRTARRYREKFPHTVDYKNPENLSCSRSSGSWFRNKHGRDDRSVNYELNIASSRNRKVDILFNMKIKAEETRFLGFRSRHHITGPHFCLLDQPNLTAAQNKSGPDPDPDRDQTRAQPGPNIQADSGSDSLLIISFTETRSRTTAARRWDRSNSWNQ